MRTCPECRVELNEIYSDADQDEYFVVFQCPECGREVEIKVREGNKKEFKSGRHGQITTER